MFRKLFFVLVALALPVLAISTVSASPSSHAQQYPPTTDPGQVQGEGANQGFGNGAGANAGANGSGSTDDGAPLPRTGTDVAPMVLIGLVLIGAGAFAWVAASRRREPTTA